MQEVAVAQLAADENGQVAAGRPRGGEPEQGGRRAPKTGTRGSDKDKTQSRRIWEVQEMEGEAEPTPRAP